MRQLPPKIVSACLFSIAFSPVIFLRKNYSQVNGDFWGDEMGIKRT